MRDDVRAENKHKTSRNRREGCHDRLDGRGVVLGGNGGNDAWGDAERHLLDQMAEQVHPDGKRTDGGGNAGGRSLVDCGNGAYNSFLQ